MPSPIQNNGAAAANQLRRLGEAAEKNSDVATNALANLAKNVVDVAKDNMKDGVLLAGSLWVADKTIEHTIGAIRGENVPGFKASTSNTDRAVAIGVYSAASLVATGVAAKSAFDIAANLVEAATKGDS
jgi:hypothetical protein